MVVITCSGQDCTSVEPDFDISTHTLYCVLPTKLLNVPVKAPTKDVVEYEFINDPPLVFKLTVSV